MSKRDTEICLIQYVVRVTGVLFTVAESELQMAGWSAFKAINQIRSFV